MAIEVEKSQTIPLLWTGEDTDPEFDIVLTKPGAEVELWGLLVGKKTRSTNVKVRVRHIAPNTTSKIIVKAALSDTSKVNVDGLVAIDKGAKGANAWLAAHLMLLSDKATGTAIPSLEIVENDVTAGHATTIGRVDDMQLFYLMSRGMTKAEARQLIVHGFLQDAIDGLPKELQDKALQELDS